MAHNLRNLRRKIRTVRSIEHITRAMQFVAAAKLQKLQRLTVSGRAYSERLRQLLEHVAAATSEEEPHPYLAEREPQRIMLVVMAGDRGLAGAFNQQLLRRADEFLSQQTLPVVFATLGERARRWVQRHGGELLVGHPAIGDLGPSSPIGGFARTLRSAYDEGQVDRIFVVHEVFQSVLRHHPALDQFLPVPMADLGSGSPVDYTYSPPAQEFMNYLLPQALDAIMTQWALETHTSEQAARMTAMQAATDSAGDMISSLSRRLNRARQAEITAEIMDVIGGASAIGAL